MEKYTKEYEQSSTQDGIKLGNGLILIDLLSLALIIVFLFSPESIIRSIIAVPILMVFPGYTILIAIFPSRDQISSIERLVFSVVLSVVQVILLGLLLNYTPWEIRVEPVLYSLSALILLNSIVALVRLKGIEKNQRFGFSLDLSWLKGSKSITNNLITLTLVFFILVALSYMIYVSTKARVDETYSEFYILGQDGGMNKYPQGLSVGGEGRVYIGVVNHEASEVIYSIVVNADGESSRAVDQLLLSDGQQWEGQINFLITTAGENKLVEFLLFRGDDESPYRKLQLQIDVTS